MRQVIKQLSGFQKKLGKKLPKMLPGMPFS
jgi:hypothetical protein